MGLPKPVWRGLAVLASAAFVLPAGTSWAAAADDALPAPDPPRLTSAIVTGCQAPCAPGESGQVIVTFTRPAAPAGARLLYWTYADGFNIGSPTAMAQRADGVELRFPICAGVNVPTRDCYPARVDALRGNEVMTVTAHAAIGNPDDGTLRVSEESAQSNGLVPRQR